ncbi:MAG: serine O-acetyltransferase EpsC [Acidobacteriota bacterium]
MCRELSFAGEDKDTAAARAEQIARAWVERLPTLQTMLELDVEAAYRGDPALKSTDEAVLCSPGITAVICFRLAHELCSLGVPLLARMVTEHAHSVTGIDIHPGAQIGESFFIDHGTGVVIGETAVVGNRVRLYQGVTLGAKSFPADPDGKLRKGIARHPILEDDVVVYSWASILAPITIGRGSIIGGNVWVTQDVPPGSLVTQAQLRQAVFSDGAGIY